MRPLIKVYRSELNYQVEAVMEAIKEFEYGSYVEFEKESEADLIKIFTVNASSKDMIMHIVERKDELGHDLVRIYRIG